MLESGVAQLLTRLGISGVTGAVALRAGLGGNELWRLHRPDGDLVVRVFPPGEPAERAERELQAHQYARDHGISAPLVHGRQSLEDRSCLVMDHVSGIGVADALWNGTDPDDLGRRCGATLAALHSIADPPPALIAERCWLDWPAPMPELRHVLKPYDTGRVTLHLDFHPENLIISADGVITVLDWANSVVGPAPADLARTLSILELIMVAVPELPETARRTVDRYRDGFLAGYRQAGGDIAIPDPVRAWAYAAQRRDMAGSWVPPWYLDHLEDRYQELVGAR